MTTKQESRREIVTLKDMLDQSSKLFGDRPAFYLKGEDEKYFDVSYNEYKDDVNSLGTAFLDMNLKDKFIAVIGENSYKWCVTYMAAANGTGVIVPLDKELPENEIANLLKRCNASALIYSDKLSDKINKIIDEIGFVDYIINMDKDQDEERILSYNQIIIKGRQLLHAENDAFLNAKIDPEKLGFLLYTSGTTDLAKGVMLSHKNLCSNIMAGSKHLNITSKDSSLSILPIHHTFECTCGFLVMMHNGCRVSFCEGLKHISKNLNETHPSLLIVVPLILEGMYKKVWDKAKKENQDKKLKIATKIASFLNNSIGVDLRKKLCKKIHESIGGNIRLVVSGAAALNPDVSKGLKSFGLNIVQGYGLTECAPIVSANTEDRNKDGSIGIPLPGVEVKIIDKDKDNIGEIITRGDNVMLGYYNNQEATDEIIKDGWLHTGDLGYMDKDGFFYITGRKKNVIITKNGKNVFPEEVESYLNLSPFILESMVWGMDIDEYDEVQIHAKLVPDFDIIFSQLEKDQISDDDLYKLIESEVKIINKKLPLYKKIRKFTIKKEELIKTTTRKIKRHEEQEIN